MLSTLPAESVHMCVTSPPFFGLRDYGTGTWEGGDAGCDHRFTPRENRELKDGSGRAGKNNQSWAERETTGVYRDTCGKCGARRVDNQIGLEESPEAWVAQLVSVFEEVRRVLRKDGTLWVECGDSYAASRSGDHSTQRDRPPQDGSFRVPSYEQREQRWMNGSGAPDKSKAPGCKPKDLIGQPFLLAFALREAGWYWRNVCIWHKPNPMPESVRDRFTVSHSYVLLFSKSPRYFFDAEAVRETLQDSTLQRGYTASKFENGRGKKAEANGDRNDAGEPWTIPSGRNARSVWTIATEPLPFEHYAAFPQALAERCIKAGTSERGCCPECGAPWVREVELSAEYRARLVQRERPEPLGAWLRERRIAKGMRQGEVAALFPSRSGGLTGCVSNWELDKNIPTLEQWDALKNALNLGDEKDPLLKAWHEWERSWNSGGLATGKSGTWPGGVSRTGNTLGWRPSCECNAGDPIPAVVMDCFGGSGTTALVSRRLGRHSILVELNERYCELAAKRTQQLSLEASA